LDQEGAPVTKVDVVCRTMLHSYMCKFFFFEKTGGMDIKGKQGFHIKLNFIIGAPLCACLLLGLLFIYITLLTLATDCRCCSFQNFSQQSASKIDCNPKKQLKRNYLSKTTAFFRVTQRSCVCGKPIFTLDKSSFLPI